MDNKPKVQHFKDADGNIYEVLTYPDGRTEERALTQDELSKYIVAPTPDTSQKIENIKEQANEKIKLEKQAQEQSEFMSPDEMQEQISKYLMSAAGLLGSTALGAGATALLTSPAAPFVGGAAALGLGYGALSDPKGTLDLLGSAAQGILRPYTNPIESFKEDPFGTAASYLPAAGLVHGIGRPFSKILGEKILTKYGSIPASKQPVADVLETGTKTMEIPLETLRQNKVDLTVPQAARNPIATAIAMSREDVQEPLIQQNRQVRNAFNKMLKQSVPPQFRGHLNIEQELGEVAQLLRYEATNRYNEIMERLHKVKGSIFREYERRMPPVKFNYQDPVSGGMVKITVRAPAKLDASIKAALKLTNDDLKFLSENTFGGVVKSEYKKALDEVSNIVANPSVASSGKTWVNIRSLEAYKHHLDRVIGKLPQDNPAASKLKVLRAAVDEDLKANLARLGLDGSYKRYNEYAHEWLDLFNNTMMGKDLPIKSVYGFKVTPTKPVAEAFKDSAQFDQLVKLVGPKMATSGLLQSIIHRSIDTNSGAVSANKLIKLLHENRSKLVYIDKGLRTRLYNFAYGLKNQNILKLGDNAALQMREANAFVKFVGATVFARTGIQIGTLTQSVGFLISKADVAKILMDPQAAWAAARLTTTAVNSPNYASRMRVLLQSLGRLGIYAKAGDTIVKFNQYGMPEPIGDIN